MAMEDVITKKTKKDGSIDFQVTTKADFDALYDAASPEVQRSNGIANVRVSYRSRVKALAKQGHEGAALQAEMDKWIPGISAPRGQVDVEAAYMAKYRAMTPDERKAEIAKLKAM